MDAVLRRVPVVLFSSADADDVSWLDAGPYGFLPKSLRIQELSEFLRGVPGRVIGDA